MTPTSFFRKKVNAELQKKKTTVSNILLFHLSICLFRRHVYEYREFGSMHPKTIEIHDH